MAEIGCRYFTGYKPCGLSDICSPKCPHRSEPRFRILVIHLEALGAVLRATSILPAIRRKYPDSHITWVTQKPADKLLENNPMVDRVLTTDTNDLLMLQALEFDISFSLDKSLKAMGVLKSVTVDQKFGFEALPSGAIVPSTDHANELWELGLSNEKKFFENKKTEVQLLAESLNLPYKRDHYIAELNKEEQIQVQLRRWQWAPQHEVLVGINTGCAPTIAYKKLPVLAQRHLVLMLKKIPNVRVVLLGGPEDTERNEQIGKGYDLVQSATEKGLRDGLCSVAACDIVITGDSLGMHMAIAFKKWTVAWFGPTCDHEIDLYDRGEKILTKANCSPCWKRSCNNNPMCYDLVELNEIIAAVKKGIEWQTSSSKRPSLETYSSPSP